MKQYINPRTEVASVQISTALLAGSNDPVITGGASQTTAW